MTEYLDTYCPVCDTEVKAELLCRPAELSVRSETVGFNETIAVCPTCGEVIGDARIEGDNLNRAYSVYRSAHGIPSPEEIKSLRESYGLSLREFSKFLGFGEQTVYRYEHGDIPDLLHSATLHAAAMSDGARRLLEQNKKRLSKRSVAAIEKHMRAMGNGASEEARFCPRLEGREVISPSALNGYRTLDLPRVFALVYELASKHSELYWTKLQKAMFFADMIFCERHSRSLTGLTYARATYGPIMDQMDEIRLLLSENGIVSFQQRGWGEVLVPQELDEQPFSEDELAFIDEIAKFVNSFNTASDVSEFSHHLKCWSEGENGRIIEYGQFDGEVGKAMDERMRRLHIA